MSNSVVLYHHALKVQQNPLGSNKFPQPDNLHEMVYQALEKTTNQKDGKRWFDTIMKGEGDRRQRLQLHFDNKTQLVVIRANTKPPENLGFKETAYEVQNGEEIRLQVRLAVQRRLPRKPGKKFLQRLGLTAEEFMASNPNPKQGIKLNTAEKHKFVRDLLVRSGLEVKAVNLSDDYATPVKSIGFNVKTVDVTAACTIQDAEKFIQALTFGIGQYKTYGFGLIRFVKKDV